MSIKDKLDALGVLDWVTENARRHGVTLEELIGRKRTPRLVRARHDTWMVVKDTMGLSWLETAMIFEVDHSSVIHAGRKKRNGQR